MKNKEKIIETIEKNWILASKKLNFEIIIPYKFNFKGKEKSAFAFLPNYGSKNGIIIGITSPPKFQTDNELIEWAKENCCSYSFLNIENYLNYTDDSFKVTLDDWGYFKK